MTDLVDINLFYGLLCELHQPTARLFVFGRLSPEIAYRNIQRSGEPILLDYKLTKTSTAAARRQHHSAADSVPPAEFWPGQEAPRLLAAVTVPQSRFRRLNRFRSCARRPGLTACRTCPLPAPAPAAAVCSRRREARARPHGKSGGAPSAGLGGG